MKFLGSLLRPALPHSLIASALIFFTGSAVAGTITTYNAQDNGAATTGPFPNTAAAQASLTSAAAGYGGVETVTFEGLATGFYTAPVAVATGVTETQTGRNFGNGGSGISNVSLNPGSNPYLYGFNTTPGGSYFLGATEDVTTFSFVAPTNSFGFIGSGLQQFGSSSIGSNLITFTFNDGSAQTVNFNNITTNGGAEYFGITDTAGFTSITITDTPGVDYWGLDDISYNTSPSVAATPEPSSLILLGTGMLGVIGAARRKLKR